jgi:RNA 2',3'-cyclic 3'-phosphodiesterase
MQRLFFALWPPLELSRELFRLGSKVLHGGAGRRVVAENIHLTLAFLGSVNATFRECAEQTASNVQVDAFSLDLEWVGCWPKSGILWVGPELTPKTLWQLVEQLNSGLAGCGHEAEKRPYAAHLTLARNARPCLPAHNIDAHRWEIDRFCLVQSHTLREGARYEILREWKLIKPAA